MNQVAFFTLISKIGFPNKKKKLEEFNNILPAIGYVNLGLIKEIIKN